MRWKVVQNNPVAKWRREVAAQLKARRKARLPRKIYDPLQWHRWFAWHPVKIDHKYVWLEYVHRKLSGFTYADDWEYRTRG
jgi:hypothetical protein